MALDFSSLAGMGDTGSFYLGDTMPSESPTINAGDTLGSTAQPSIAVIPQSDSGVSLDGVFQAVNSTASNLAAAWGKIQNTVTSTVAANNNASIQQTQSGQAAALAKLQAQAQLTAAQAQAKAATSGLSFDWPTMLAAVGLLFTIAQFSKSK